MHPYSRFKSDVCSFIVSITLLNIIGIISIYSASSVYALEIFGNPHYYVKQHAVGLLLGILVAAFIQFFPLWVIYRLSFVGLLAATGLTALTLFSRFSNTIHGSCRWLNIGGFAFQPSELIKIGLIMSIAVYLSKKTSSPLSVKTYIPLLVIIGVPSLILLQQPDFGLTVTLCLTALSMVFIANINIWHVMIALSSFIPLCIWLVATRAYRLQRILTFLNPWQDPQGSGFQVIQSLIAIGSGGIVGKGIGGSHQKFFYLPMQHTDFIFSIIAEETGFLGSTIIILLFAAFLFFGIRLATCFTNSFCQLATFGCVTLMSLQALINMCVATGIAPTKGIGLPFISYGNTALITHLAMIGLIIRFIRDERRLRFGKNWGKQRV